MIHREEKHYVNGNETQLSLDSVTVRQLVLELLNYPLDATVDMSCDHYQGDFPKMTLDIGAFPG